jgi:hypothetical protein
MTKWKYPVSSAFIAFAMTGCIVGEDQLSEPVDEQDLAVAPPKATGYAFAKDGGERKKSVPIESHENWHVVYSVPAKDLAPAERLAVRGEVQLTTCQASDLGDTPCKRITPFDPKFAVKIVLGTSDHDATGKDLSQKRDTTCSHFDHHCAVAIDERTSSNLSGFGFVNLVVSATGSSPGKQDLMIVDDHHGGVYATRIGAKADASGSQVPGKIRTSGWMKLDMANAHPRKEHTTLQATVHGVSAGDVLSVEALVEAKTRGSGSKPAGCQGARDPLITNQIFLSKHANDPVASKLGSFTAKNGQNCKLGTTCKYRKSGAMQLPKSVPSTVYVSVVSMGGRSCSAPNDEWSLGNDSKLVVKRLHAK